MIYGFINDWLNFFFNLLGIKATGWKFIGCHSNRDSFVSI